MINVILEPPAISSFSDPAQPPIPLSDCLEFCLQPDTADVFITTGAKATVVFVIPITATVPANGTTFTVWGHDFTVDSANDFTANTFKANTIGLLTVLNLANMFYANIFFNRSVTMTFAIVMGMYELTMVWNECREQPNFTGGNMDLAVFGTIGGSATPTQGISPEFTEAFRLLVRTVRWQDATSGFVTLSQLAGLDVEKLCDTVGQNCIQINADVSADLFTLLPEMTNDSFIQAIDNGRSMMRFYSLEYGWTYRENCVAKSGTIMRSDRVLVLNAAFDIDDPYQLRRYWWNHPGGLPPDQFVVDYLTTQPKTIPLCRSSFKWLWLLNNWQDEFGEYALIARFVIYDANGSIVTTLTAVVNNPLTQASSNYQVVNFNVSPSYITEVLGYAGTLYSYEVQVVGTEPLDYGDIQFNATEYLRFDVTDCCDDDADLYFLSPTGSIDTVNVRIDKNEVLQSGGEEIKVQIGCETSRDDRAANGGRSLVRTRVYQRLTMSVQGKRNDEWSRWFKHLRQSPQRWIRVKDEGGNWLAKKIVFDTGSLKIKQSGIGDTLEMVGYLQDVPTQNGTEKFIL